MARFPFLLFLIVPVLSGCTREGAPSPVEIDTSSLEPSLRTMFETLITRANEDGQAAEPRARLGMAYEANGLLESSRASYAQAIALDPANARWHYHAAVVAHTAGDVDDAIRHMDEAIARDDEYAPAHWRRGNWLFAQGRMADAAESYRRANELKPKHPAGWLGLARIHLQRDEHEEAARLLLSAIERRPRSPFVPYLRQLLGIAYRGLGRLDDARVELARGLAGRPSWSDAWHDEIQQYRVSLIEQIRRAQALVESQQNEEAIRLLEELRPDHPQNRLLLEALGVAYLRTSRLAEAEAAFDLLVRHHPDVALAQVNRSVVLAQIGRLEDALAAADAAIDLHPKLPAGHRQRAHVLEQMMNDEAAFAAYQETIRLDPTDVDALVSAAAIATRRGHHSEAIALAERARDRDPSDPRALRLLQRLKAVGGP